VKLAYLTSVAVCVALAVATHPAQAEPFNGPFIGVEAGYESYPDDLSGGVASLVAGWDFKINDHWVVGVEGRYGEPSASDTETVASTTSTAVSKVELSNQYGAGLRVGRIFGERLLVYGTVGAERFDVEAIRTVTPRAPCTNCNPVRSDFSFTEDVTTFGIGTEWAVADNWSIHGAYTRADGDAYERNSITAGLKLRF